MCLYVGKNIPPWAQRVYCVPTKLMLKTKIYLTQFFKIKKIVNKDMLNIRVLFIKE